MMVMVMLKMVLLIGVHDDFDNLGIEVIELTNEPCTILCLSALTKEKAKEGRKFLFLFQASPFCVGGGVQH